MSEREHQSTNSKISFNLKTLGISSTVESHNFELPPVLKILAISCLPGIYEESSLTTTKYWPPRAFSGTLITDASIHPTLRQRVASGPSTAKFGLFIYAVEISILFFFNLLAHVVSNPKPTFRGDYPFDRFFLHMSLNGAKNPRG
jgi:hypothetical protein